MKEIIHKPVLLNESIQGLNIKPQGTYIDLTYGQGNHSKEILANLSDKGQLIAFDLDKNIEKYLIHDNRFSFFRYNFRFFGNILHYTGIQKVDGILADLGIASFHLDSPERGFSFRFNAPLDMRIDTNISSTAADIINTYNYEELINIFSEYGNVYNSKTLARTIIQKRKNKTIKTSYEFIECIKERIPKHNPHKYLAKVFQALRIKVNNELDALREMLLQTVNFLKSGARLVIISYHSGEDRLVKNFMKTGRFSTQYHKDIFGNISVPFKLINKKVIVPGKNEIQQNKRARSAKLRIAEKK